MQISPKGESMKKLLAITILGAWLPALQSLAFDTGYRGVSPFKEDYLPIHEMVTSEGMRLLCQGHGAQALNQSSFGKRFLSSPIKSCDDLFLPPKQKSWANNVATSPIRGLLLGSRFPDLFELTGLDANKVELKLLKHNPDVDIDSYRLYPHWHAQLSYYHNVFDGDQNLGVRVIKDAMKHHILEAIAATNNPLASQPPNVVVAANHMLKHDTNLSRRDLFFQVDWYQIEIGKVLHMIGDLFAKSPLMVVDQRKGQLIHTGLTYGWFQQEDGTRIYVDNLKGPLGLTGGVGPGKNHEEGHLWGRDRRGALDFKEIPPQHPAGFPYLRTSVRGQLFPTGYLKTTLAAAAIHEMMEVVFLSSSEGYSQAKIQNLINDLMAKYLNFDLMFHAPEFVPVTVYNHMTEAQKSLPWFNYHHVDLWSETQLDDISKRGYQGLLLPYADRQSMAGIEDPRTMPPRFLIVGHPSDGGQQIARSSVRIFQSWGSASSDDIEIHPEDLPNSGLNLIIQERFTSPSGNLKKAHAFAYIPKGMEVCIEVPTNGQRPLKPRLAAFDFSKARFRCRIGVEEGITHSIQFHIPKDSRIWARSIGEG